MGIQVQPPPAAYISCCYPDALYRTGHVIRSTRRPFKLELQAHAEAIRHGLAIGHGKGPTNHFYFLKA